ncbi:MAG: imidazole glycerol phosphate synthase subunit HisH, partial [Campylobacterales bacterium]|nr:imidazole glycerol phosphate synthase subunit HisH [Campylobacterales bacterium]
LILPGVGAFGDAMEHLRSNGMDEAITSFAQSGKNILGICLGMQLLFDESKEFGAHKGLGLIPGEIVKFNEQRFDHRLKIPHMGWNEIFIKDSPLFENLPKAFYLYFVHSYHALCEDKYTIGICNYGYEFSAAVQKENILGLQPHPEKSHKNGLKILENFAKL